MAIDLDVAAQRGRRAVTQLRQRLASEPAGSRRRPALEAAAKQAEAALAATEAARSRTLTPALAPSHNVGGLSVPPPPAAISPAGVAPNAAAPSPQPAPAGEAGSSPLPPIAGGAAPSALYSAARVPPEQQQSALDDMAAGVPHTMPTRAGVDGAAMPAVTPSLAPSHDAIPHQIAAEVAQRMARYETGGVPAALDDPTPLRAGDEQTDIMERLTDAILNPRKQADVHVPFSKGETIALGIIGGTSPEAFQNVVMPLIQGELQRGDKESENRQREQDRQIGALQALATLRESQSRDRQTALYQQAQMEDNRIRALAAAENAETARKKAEAAATAGKPVPAGLMASYERIAGGAKASEEVAKIMDDNYSLAGGYPGGPIAGHLPGGVRNVLYPKLALINDAILAHFMRRSQGNSDLARQYTEPYLLKLTTWGSRLRQQVNEAYDLLHATAKTDRISYPQALYKEGIMHETYDPDELEIAAGAQGGAVTHIAPPPPGSYVDPDFDEAVGE